jgi:hypothetical protein
MYQKATGITRRVLPEKEFVELWVGDVINCKVYYTDRSGGYLHIEDGEVIWDREYGMFSIVGEYMVSGGTRYRETFPLHKVVRDPIEFVKKVPRTYGTTENVVWDILSNLKSFADNPPEPEFGPDEFPVSPEYAVSKATVEMVMTLVSEIGDMGVISKEDIEKYMESER